MFQHHEIRTAMPRASESGFGVWALSERQGEVLTVLNQYHDSIVGCSPWFIAGKIVVDSQHAILEPGHGERGLKESVLVGGRHGKLVMMMTAVVIDHLRFI